MENSDLIGSLEARLQRVEGAAEDKYWFVSQDPAMAKVNEWLTVLRKEAMRGDGDEASVLILGESGTGKEGVARMIHMGSRRAKGPWIAIKCGGANENFHEIELAKGGTLYLDEINFLSVGSQEKLLSCLQEHGSSIRVIAAASGAFYDELYRHISRVVVEMPTLCERQGDLVPLALLFAERAFYSCGKKFVGFAPDVEAVLHQYSWPGNVRELYAVIERAACVYNGTCPVSLDIGVSSAAAPENTRQTLESYTVLKKRWSDVFEREYLVTVLAKHYGNVSAAAREAKLDRSNFLRLLRRHQLNANQYRKVA
jgi:two-component system response regulator GlrR